MINAIGRGLHWQIYVWITPSGLCHFTIITKILLVCLFLYFIECLLPHTYESSPTKVSWQKARNYCQIINGDLAVEGMKNFEKRTEIVNVLGHGQYWFGASDIAEESEWKWTDGSVVRSEDMHWYPGDPDGNVGQDCAALFSMYDWKSIDAACTNAYYALCEIPGESCIQG